MIKLAKIAKMTLVAVAIAPLFPVLGLMWFAKGVEVLSNKKAAAKPSSATSPMKTWDFDTLSYLPNA